MLSSIGRAAIRRTGARAFTRTNPHSPSIWQLQRNSPSEWRDQLAARPLFYRGFATATKTATKAATTKPKKPAAKTTKKPAKRPAKKVAKKQVAKPKRKPTLKKPVKKRVTTEKAKIRLEKTKKTAESRAVKETALLTPSNSLPKPLPANAYMVYMAEKTRSSGIEEGAKATERLTELAHKWKEISPAELESYNHQANENKRNNSIAYKKWVESHTPDQIRLANNARRLLARQQGKSMRSMHLIRDERLPSMPANPVPLFVKDRYASGDFKGVASGEAMKLIHAEFQALPAAEKKVYTDRSLADRQRYVHEFTTVFGRAPEHSAL